MKGYSAKIPENCACARLEGVNASYKDLAQVCGRIKDKKTTWAIPFLEKASTGEIPVFYRRHNKRLGHRKELGGKKGRYPKKAAVIVLKTLLSAIANGKVKGLGADYTVLTASANKKDVFPRLASKGRWARSNLETSRVEIILQGKEIPKGVEVTPPKKPEAKKEEKKPDEKKPEAKKEEKKPVAKEAKPKEEKPEPKTEKKPEAKKEEVKKEPEPKKEAKPETGSGKPETESRPQPELLKNEAAAHHQHKHGMEKTHEQEKKRKEMPHQRGEYGKR